jgi:signal transduction histidine kinase
MSNVPQARRTLTVVTRRISDREIEIAIHDQGCGLTDDSAGHLFEPFFSTTPNGLGLGLSISRTIVESHGGRIELSSNDDSGVTVRVFLPVNSSEAPYVTAADGVHRR